MQSITVFSHRANLNVYKGNIVAAINVFACAIISACNFNFRVTRNINSSCFIYQLSEVECGYVRKLV